MITTACAATAGASAPLGAAVLPDGVNFSVYASHATRVELLLFDHQDAAEPAQVIELDPASHRTRDDLVSYWEPLEFELPPLRPRSDTSWRRCIDTALPAPDDIRPWTAAPAVAEKRYLVQPRSVVVLSLELHRSGGPAPAE